MPADERAAIGRADSAPIEKDTPKERARGLNDIAGLKDGHAAKVEEMEAAKHAFDKYKTIGPSQALVKNQTFEYITLSVIAFNGIWIGYDVDKNKDSITEAATLFQVMENFFCFFFTFEVGVRFLAYHTKRQCTRDSWFVFDSTLVTFMILETWVVLFFSAEGLKSFSVLRLLRLARLARMARLMRAFPDLVVLIKGMGAATRTVGSTLFLLVIFMYVFGIIFTQQLRPLCGKYDYPDTRVCLEPCSANPECIKENGEEAFVVAGPWMIWNWDQPMFPELLVNEGCLADDSCDTWGIDYNPWETVPVSMYSLFLAGTLCDDATFVTQQFLPGSIPGYKGNLGMLMVYYVYVLLSSFTVLNMLIGVLCEVISETTQDEEEKAVTMQITEELEKVFSEIDKDGNYLVSQQEFRAMVKNERVLDAFRQIEVEKEHLLALSDTLFEQPESAEEVKKRVTAQQKHRSTANRPPSQSVASGGGSFNAKIEALGKEQKRFSTRPPKEQVELTFDEFVEAVVHMRPKNPASVMHIAELKQMLRAMTKGVECQLEETLKQFPEYDDPDDEFDRLSKEVEGTFKECFDLLARSSLPVMSPRLPAVESIAEPNVGRSAQKTATQTSQPVSQHELDDNMANLDGPASTSPAHSPEP